MNLITNINELLENIQIVEKYLTEGDTFEMSETIKLIKRGTCFVAYNIGKEVRFAPSRFVGYTSNTLQKHMVSDTKDGRETNKAINKILQPDPLSNERLEELYISYCNNLGIYPGITGAYGAPRKYWTLTLKNDFSENLELSGEFPEGKIVERTHKVRERNSLVIKIAKDNFKKNNNGRLFCQACRFDFEEKYGIIGIDFIEGHHILPVNEMNENHKTKPEDIAMLCSNCHKMIHKKRPWLSMDKLHLLLK
ncbi:MAG TPA: HNH endonuclease [Puia sp.]|jgi:5-methylcytosine-specific restriction protein A